MLQQLPCGCVLLGSRASGCLCIHDCIMWRIEFQEQNNTVLPCGLYFVISPRPCFLQPEAVLKRCLRVCHRLHWHSGWPFSCFKDAGEEGGWVACAFSSIPRAAGNRCKGTLIPLFTLRTAWIRRKFRGWPLSPDLKPPLVIPKIILPD